METGDATTAVLVHLEYIKRAADETNAHLRALNGRVSSVETRVTVIETQANDAKHAGAKWGGIVSGIIGGATFAWQFFKGQP